MGRPSNTEQRRGEIVQALLKVMSEQGYAKASIQAIARQAGLRPGLIHYHFKTKQEILVELVRWVSDQTQQRYMNMLQEASTSDEKLRAFIDSRLAKGDDELPEAVAAWVVIGTEAIRQPEVKQLYEQIIADQQSVLKTLIKGVARRKLSTKEATEISSIILAAIEGAYKLSAATSGIIPEGYAASSLLKLVEGYLEH